MGEEVAVSLPEYTRRKPSGYYWEPSRKVRALGFSSEALGHDPVEAVRKARDLNKRVRAALKSEAAGEPVSIDGTLGWAITEYKRSEDWRKLAESTRRGYRQCLDRAEEWAGSEHVSAITRKAVKAWYRRLYEEAPAYAAATVRALRIVVHFAKDEGYQVADLGKLKLHTAIGDGEPWEPWEISAYWDEARRRGRRSMGLALMLGVCLGQREGDIINLARSAYDPAEGVIRIRQRKTGKALAVPVLPELRRELETAPKAGTIFVISETNGKPYGVDHFRHLHRKICRAAGISDERKFMHLRHTAATRLGDAGCSEDLIRSITGHTSDAIRRYVKPTDTMAKAAITKLIEHRNRKAE